MFIARQMHIIFQNAMWDFYLILSSKYRNFIKYIRITVNYMCNLRLLSESSHIYSDDSFIIVHRSNRLVHTEGVQIPGGLKGLSQITTQPENLFGPTHTPKYTKI